MFRFSNDIRKPDHIVRFSNSKTPFENRTSDIEPDKIVPISNGQTFSTALRRYLIAYPNVDMYFLRSLKALLDKKIMIIAQIVGHNNKQN